MLLGGLAVSPGILLSFGDSDLSSIFGDDFMFLFSPAHLRSAFRKVVQSGRVILGQNMAFYEALIGSIIIVRFVKHLKDMLIQAPAACYHRSTNSAWRICSSFTI